VARGATFEQGRRPTLRLLPQPSALSGISFVFRPSSFASKRCYSDKNTYRDSSTFCRSISESTGCKNHVSRAVADARVRVQRQFAAVLLRRGLVDVSLPATYPGNMSSKRENDDMMEGARDGLR
jgi:hypothetical protein